MGRVWWYIPVLLELGTLEIEKEDWEFKDSLCLKTKKQEPQTNENPWNHGLDLVKWG